MEQHQCGEIQIHIQTPDRKSGATDGETQRSCDSLVPKRAPTLVERHEEMLGVDEKTAVKFCTEWYKSKRQETSAIWKQRKLRNTNTHEFSMSELQEQVEEIVIRKRNMRPPEKTLPNEEYRS